MPVLLQPRAWGAHLLVVVAVAAAVLLGLWQLGAWQSAREAEARDLSSAEPVALNDVMTGFDPFPGQYVGQPVTMAGEWLSESTLFVADRGRAGELGYWVMTPLLVDGSDDGAGGPSAIPVVRGWSDLAEAPPVAGRAELTGWLQPSEGSSLPDPGEGRDVIAEMRIASVTQFVDVDLYSGFVVAEQSTDGLAAVSPEQIPSVSPVTSLKNLLYAFQWWVFGLFAVYIWQRWCRDELERDAVGDVAEEEAEPTGSAVERPVGSQA